MDFISKEGQINLKSFKYRGSDLSLSYKYLWSPFAEVLLKYTPADIAPNTITIVGFVLQSIATVILCLQLPYNSDAPKWALFLYGFCVCTYQMLDNLDGKQARKLQNSTPLGMIMDHGCDALGVICLSAGMGRVVCIEDPLIILWTFIFAMFSFYISAWCQYWSNGVMILGKFNGVDDGIPIIWTTTFFSVIFGQAIWRTPVEIFGFTSTAGNIVAYCVIVMTIAQILSVKAEAGDQFTKQIGRALKDLIHAAMIFATLLLITLKGDFAHEYAAGIGIGLTFTMSRSVTYTLVCSTTKMEFKQFTPSMLLFTLGYSIYVLVGRSWMSPGVVVYGIAAFAIVQYFFYVISITRQIAKVLDIRIFHVFKPIRSNS